MTVINDMIRNAKGRKLEILKELKKYNKEGYLFMMQPGSTFKPKYRSLQKTDMWKKAKDLLLEYFKIEQGILKCGICGQYLKKPVMHHVKYDPINLFTPIYIQMISVYCHSKEHSKV